MKKILTATAALVLAASPAFGWGKTGHRVTGAIAQQYLSDDARAAVEELLGVEDLAEASTWPDFMRSSSEEFWAAAGPYHYVTIPEGTQYDLSMAPEVGDAYTALQQFSAIVTNEDLPLDERQRALRFIVHIIGDLHQPLHVGDGTDRGGNDVTVVFFDTVTNLHLTWDDEMIDYDRLSYSELANWLSRRITPELADEWMVADPLVWISESAQIRPSLYPDDAELQYQYFFEHRDTMRTRMSQAGIRMAAYLNELFED
ncbi:S1/P1 nuclease [Hyphobacterium sp. HN65]|uniref:S1/P1 nuclease n=1 Tax=Hyphobacterium lacteum TaxID=3116575 RepID=A0ABU7LTL7_9PROT|nr:S1/P1 nuclease [Hyphobacterium sp. HN65]MEE2527239.1 S1/P1 nuclease [Hyphobacterium sp. HN65]